MAVVWVTGKGGGKGREEGERGGRRGREEGKGERGRTARLITLKGGLLKRSEERRVGKECRSRW